MGENNVGERRADTAAQALAGLLQELKDRSGRTYEGLARRSGLSRSSVHRYCRGLILPDSFAPLEALGQACGANRAELAELYRLWSAADSERAGPRDGGLPAQLRGNLRQVITPAGDQSVQPRGVRGLLRSRTVLAALATSWLAARPGIPEPPS